MVFAGGVGAGLGGKLVGEFDAAVGAAEEDVAPGVGVDAGADDLRGRPVVVHLAAGLHGDVEAEDLAGHQVGIAHALDGNAALHLVSVRRRAGETGQLLGLEADEVEPVLAREEGLAAGGVFVVEAAERPEPELLAGPGAALQLLGVHRVEEDFQAVALPEVVECGPWRCFPSGSGHVEHEVEAVVVPGHLDREVVDDLERPGSPRARPARGAGGSAGMSFHASKLSPIGMGLFRYGTTANCSDLKVGA